jgi:hypothetical protein
MSFSAKDFTTLTLYKWVKFGEDFFLNNASGLQPDNRVKWCKAITGAYTKSETNKVVDLDAFVWIRPRGFAPGYVERRGTSIRFYLKPQFAKLQPNAPLHDPKDTIPF